MKLPLDKGDKLKEGSWEAYQGGGCECIFGGKKLEDEGGEGVWKIELVPMCAGMLLVKECCSWRRGVQTKNMEGSVCSK